MPLLEVTTESFAPGPVLLLGAPGVGKGTQAQLLMRAWDVPQVSTGDLIRDNIQKQTSVGVRFKDLVASGSLVPDEIVNEMVQNRLLQADAVRGYILDGYPRTLGQATWLDGYLANCSTKQLPVIAVSIQVRYDELLRRITGRRTGRASKKIYNIYTNPPVVQGVCDVDGEPLVQRPDDSEEIFVERMKAFAELTEPVIAHYRDLGRFEVVDGQDSVEVVTGKIVQALGRLRRGAL